MLPNGPTFDRWFRRGLIFAAGRAWTPLYFRLLNTIRAEGTDVLLSLPRKGVIFLSNHQTYFTEAIAFYDLVYVRLGLPYENPLLRFSAAEETMKANLVTEVLTKAGGVTFRRSFRAAGQDVNRPVDLEGVARLEAAIADGWLLHFPAGTTQRNAPIRPGMAQLLHRTKALAVPVRVDGFKDLLLHKQIPGRLFKKASIRVFPPLELSEFYERPFEKERGRKVIEQLGALINDPPEAA